MKFLLTVHQFFPDFSAGTEVLTLAVARELRARGHEVRVLTGYPSPHPVQGDEQFNDYLHDGILVYRFHHSYTQADARQSSTALGYDNQVAAEYFSRIVQVYRPDVVHFFHLNRLGTGLIDCAVKAGIPAFMSPTDFWVICPTATLMLQNGTTCHGPSAHAGNCVQHFASSTAATRNTVASQVVRLIPVPLLDTLAKLTLDHRLPAYPRSREVASMAERVTKNVSRLNMLQKIVVPTDLMRGLLQRYGVSPDRLAKLPYGIDIADRVKRDYGVRGATPLRVGFIGTLAVYKGAHVLLDAVKLLPRGAVRVAVYGNPQDYPDYAAELVEQAQGRADIEFRGVFPNADIAKIFTGFDVLVVPSLWHENTPLVIHSALAAGCPVVASDTLGITEVLRHRHNGLLFEPGNGAALATQLRALMDEPTLLQTLSDLCQPLQSTAGYVDAMMEYWAGTTRNAIRPC